MINNNMCSCMCSICCLQQKISCICNNEYEYFLNKQNVVGIGCGYKFTNGFNTCNLCIQVFVKNKISNDNLPPYDMIPPTYKDVLTDVIESNIFTTSSLTQKVRPVEGGFCVNSLTGGTNYGTAGYLVTDGHSQYLLSTNHALASGNKVPLGTPIVQPSTNYGGKQTDVIAQLSKFIPLQPIQGSHKPVNYADCAIGKLTAPGIVAPSIHFLGKLKGTKKAKLGEQVMKVGAISELTQGTITSLDATITVHGLGETQYLFKDQIITTKMSSSGDSGAILVDHNKYGIGLLSGDSASQSIYAPLESTLKLLKVHLI